MLQKVLYKQPDLRAWDLLISWEAFLQKKTEVKNLKGETDHEINSF